MRPTRCALLALLLLTGCADILGLDPLGPVVRTGDDEDDHLPDAGAEASTPSDASEQ
jgi:hypothetical protein